MRNRLIAVTASVFVIFSFDAFSANPTSITFESEGIAPNNKKYANYIVKCSNGARQPLTAWDKRKKWCVGSESDENCHKRQITAAKKACKA